MEDNILHPIEIPTKITNNKLKISKFLVVPSIIILVFFVLIVGIYFVISGPINSIVSKGKKLQVIGTEISTAAKAQDLGTVKSKLGEVEVQLTSIKTDYQKLAWLGFLPYYADGKNALSAAGNLLDAAKIAVDGIAPYADVIGLKGLATTGDGAKTAQDRISFIVETLDKMKPQLAEIGAKMASAKTSIDKIDVTKYPVEFRGKPLRAKLLEGKNLLDQVASLVNDARPMLESAPFMLGKDKPRKYLVLFQNDAELRPTGGFLTGFAVIQVDKGKISVIQSDDIYKLDEKFPKRIAAPSPIKKYHPNVPYWYLRDQNLSPDFKASMDVFMPNYLLTGSPKVDGVIAMTTKVLVDMLKVTGPIGVPGYGNFSANNDPRCNCPNAFYELQVLAGSEEPVIWDTVSGKIVKAPANYGNRKAFLGPVMYSILANVMSQPKAKMPLLFQTALDLIGGREIMLYYYDEKTQSAVEAFNMAGRVRTASEGQDYLMVVDTNFSGGKTNIWVRYEASQVIEVAKDGTVTKTLTLNYTNPQEGSVKIDSGRRLNGLFRDWLRVYVPKGSTLIETKGFETGEAVGEDLGKTTIEGFFTLAPLNVKSITIKYKLPFKMKSTYNMLVQKQGGAKDFIYKTKINGKNFPEFSLKADVENAFVY